MNERLVEYADALPLLRSIVNGEASFDDVILDEFYAKHGSRIQLTGGRLIKVTNIEKLLQRVPMPPPPMVDGDVSDFFGRVALAAYPWWKSPKRPSFAEKIDFASLPIATWKLFASWFSHSITSFDLSWFALPKDFGASMPANTLEILVREETTHADDSWDVDDSDIDEDYEEEGEDDEESTSEEPFITVRPIDFSCMPPSLQTLSIKAYHLERENDWTQLPNTLTKLIVKCSTEVHFETLVQAALPTSLTQLHICAYKTPNMKVLTHLSPSVTRLSLLFRHWSHEDDIDEHRIREVENDDSNLFLYLPSTVQRLRLETIDAVLLSSGAHSFDSALARNPNLTISFTDQAKLAYAVRQRKKALERRARGPQKESDGPQQFGRERGLPQRK